VYSDTLKKVGSVPYKAVNLRLNHFGEEKTLEDFTIKHLIINFVYLSCNDVCPTGLSKFQKILKWSSTKNNKINLLSISFDLKRDSAVRLKKLWKLYGSPANWSIVSIAENELKLKNKMIDFGVWVKLDRLGRYNHTGFFFLLNPEGYVVEIFYPNQELFTAIKKILG
jgi:cytochrome oxidase Cu insertion factor (SCO1/SenC/PrrC family)